MKRAALRAAFPRTLPVLTGYIFLGIAFGILLADKGYGTLWAFLMSLLIYAGSMQFVAIDLLTGTFLPLEAALLTLMVNARHLFYGLSLLEKYRGCGKLRPYLIFSITDETFSLLCGGPAPPGVDERWYYFFVSIFNHSYWVTGSVLGAAAGSLLAFDATGIDFVMTALFAVIFLEQWENSRNHLPALLGLGVTALCLLLCGPDNFLLWALAGIFAGLCALRPLLPGSGEGGGAS